MSPICRILGILLAIALAACSDRDLSSGAELPTAPESSSTPESAASAQASTAPQDDLLGAGFVVWESNRADTNQRGAWRLWRKDFGGRDLNPTEGARPLTPAEPSRAHCCAHIAPDGQSLVYLSLPVGQAAYPKNGAVGELRRLDLAASGPQLGEVLAPRARTYFEHRAAVWRGSEELIWIDGEGRTVLTSLTDDSSRVLVSQGSPAHGWLLNPSLTFASRGAPTFSPYDAESQKVQELDKLGGCQPYFSADGRLGVWVAGAGGPIRAIDLQSRRQWPILNKGDERLPDSHRYLYFPMPSSDGYALAWAASNDEHDHTRADYDIFVAATDPKTLELVGPAVQISRHPSTDRFPSVWLVPTELGRHTGEAPFTVQLKAPPQGSNATAGSWIWDLDGGKIDRAQSEANGDGPRVVATWQQPGSYEVTARPSEDPSNSAQVARGWVHVHPAQAPKLVGSELRNRGTELHLQFDEPIHVDDAQVEIQGSTDIRVVEKHLDPSGTVWQLRLSDPIQRPTQVVIRSVRDRASQPNVLRQEKLRVEPPRWPTARRDLVFLWQSARHANRISAAGDQAGEAQTTLLEAKGRSFVDRWGRMVLRGGAFQADTDTMDRLFLGLKAGNELTLELTFVADRGSTEKPGALFSFAAGTRRNLIVTQEDDRLKLRLRTPSSGQNADRPIVDLGQVRPGVAQHLVVTYSPGRLRAYLDGEPTADTQELKSGFFHWQRTWLRLGAMGPPDGDGRRFPWSWRGTLEGVAVYDRPLSPEEAASHHRRYQQIRERRETVDTLSVTARLLRRSPTPSLQEIAPYREALAVFEYQNTATQEPIRVVHRVLIDGQETPLAGLAKGSTVSLRLEPFDAQPQLESLFLSNDLPGDGKLYWSDRLDP